MDRELHNQAGDVATISVSYPAQTGPESDEYRCLIGFRSPLRAIEQKVYGLGEMQAMYLGMCGLWALIQRVNSELEPKDRWVWRGGMDDEDFGLPRLSGLS